MNDQNTSLKTFHLLLPYLWPKQRRDLKLRVLFAFFFWHFGELFNFLYVGKNKETFEIIQ